MLEGVDFPKCRNETQKAELFKSMEQVIRRRLELREKNNIYLIEEGKEICPQCGSTNLMLIAGEYMMCCDCGHHIYPIPNQEG